MQKLTEVLAMGGYGGFVWPSYAMAACMLLGVALISYRSLRRAQADLRSLQLPAKPDET